MEHNNEISNAILSFYVETSLLNQEWLIIFLWVLEIIAARPIKTKPSVSGF